MSKVASVVGTVASIAAVIPGPHQPIAMAVAVAANLTAQLTARKPPARGSVSDVTIGANMPIPCVLGRGYAGGNRVLDVGYGGTVSKVKNPYRSLVDIWSLGPVQEIEGFYSDFAHIQLSGTAATGYYSGFMHVARQLGATPTATALAGPWGAIPQWGASHRLSGYAAGLTSVKFDKDGKKFAGGLPQFGAVVKGVKVYDPRLDSTYPGGTGTQRFDNEATWTWTENPALHAIAYARGRYHNGKKVFGCGFTKESIDLAAYVELANVCDANGWKVGGTIYEPGSRWDNLKRILETAAAEPLFVGARLSVRFASPKIALDTITAADLADGEYQVSAMKTWRDRKNAIVPRYRSEQHKWEYVQSDQVTVQAYVTEDGEEKVQELQFDLVQHKDQAAQLAAYKLVDGREFGPITIHCKPRLMEYVPGECLNLNIPELGLNNQLALMIGRSVDPATGIVALTFQSETTAKHAFALGRTGTAPPTPSITTGEELDETVITNSETAATFTNLISTSSQVNLTVTATPTSATISNHIRRYIDKDVNVTGATISSLTASTAYWFYYDDPDRAGGAVSYTATTNYFDAFPSPANPNRHYAGYVTTPATGTSTGGGSLPPGGGGSSPYNNEVIP